MFSKCLTVLAVLILTLYTVIPVSAQLGDITQADQTTVDIGGMVDGDEISYTIASVVPLADINGGVQVYVQQQQSDGEVISETFKSRLEGGFDIWKLDIAGFVEFERSLKEGTTTGSIGPFVRFPEYVNGNLGVSSGFGSWLQNQQLQSEVGEAESLGAYSVRPFAYCSVDYRAVNLFLKLSTDYQDFGDIEGEITPSAIFQIADNVPVGMLASFKYIRNSDMNWYTKYSVVARTTF